MKVLSKGCDLDLFFKELKAAKKRVLFLDYDGTLAPFRKERSEAVPYPGVCQALNTLLKNNTSKLVLISGRSVDDLTPLLGLKTLPEIWGSHGWERLKPGGICERPEFNEVIALGLAKAIECVNAEGLIDRLEQKPVSVALHWRGLTDNEIKNISDNILSYWGYIAKKAGLILAQFDGGIELKAPGHNKGDAVQTVLEEEGEGVITAYLGDDLTDEDAFSVLKGRGLSLLVRKELRPTAADLWIEPPEELLTFLHNWNLACSDRQGEDTQ